MNRIARIMSRVMSGVMLAALVVLSSTLLAQTSSNLPLQQGISVEMAMATGAGSLPEADNPDAWIVTVTDHGDLYFGVQPVTADGLLDAMKVRPRNRAQELYIKTDGRAPAADVSRALEAARADFFKRAFLLTAAQSGAQPGTMIAPKGLPVWLAQESSNAVVVRISAGQGSPTLKINNEEVPLKMLHRKLEQLLQNPNDREVVLKAEQVPMADVIHVVDVCNMVGAKAILAPSGL